MEESLRRSERQAAETLTLLETLQAAAPVGLGFVDRELRVIRANDAFAATAGAPVTQQLGRTVAEVIPAIWPQVEPAYRRVLDTGEALLNVEVTGPCPDSRG